MKKDSKKIIIILLIMVSIFTIFLTTKELINKEELPEKVINNIVKNKSFAIMITNDNGIGYKEYEGETWPEGYSLANAECTDNNGNKVEEAISYDESTNKITLKAKRTVYCTLYFEEKTIINELRKNDVNGVISENLVGDMYRYQGYDKQYSSSGKVVDNNYICFGTNDIGECTSNPDKYMYRIIGVTSNNELKIIKKTGIEEGGINKFTWNNISSGNDINWDNSLIYKRLNGLSKGSTNGSGTSVDKGNTDIFINNENYPYMQEENNWYDLIETHNWIYGEIYLYSYYNLGIDKIYEKEIGREFVDHYILKDGAINLEEYKWSKTIPAKVGLMYIHDYLLSVAGNNNGKKESWIFGNNNDKNIEKEWLMTSWGRDAVNELYSAWYIMPEGTVHHAYNFDIQNSVRPVFYIKSGIELAGNGAENDPYVILKRNKDGKIYYDYEYTGNYQTFKAPDDGKYKIELWGASGGQNKGLGAYTAGTIDLKKGKILYVYVGEAGYMESKITVDNYNQGKYIKYTFNGGAAGNFWCLKNGNGTGSNILGGGATDVRLESGAWDNFNGLKSRIMVAAGGGGGAADPGGAGGGIIGYDGLKDHRSQITGDYQGKGGTQILGGNANGSFGKGGIAIYNGDVCNSNDGAGGGSGYYGGGGTIGVGQNTGGNAAGGSSYISGHNGCRAITSNSNEGNISHSDNSNHYSNMIFKDTIMIDGKGYNWTDKIGALINQPSPSGGSQTGNNGNGFARITKID